MLLDNFHLLIIIGLASFRLTRLVVFDKITKSIRAIFLDEYEEINEKGEKEVIKVAKGGSVRKFIGELIMCYWCVSMWVSGLLVLLFKFFPSFTEVVILIFAIAAIGSIVETIIIYFLKLINN